MDRFSIPPSSLQRSPLRRLGVILFQIVLTILALFVSSCGGRGQPGLLGGGSGLFKTYYVYTANQGSNDISIFRSLEDGTLTYLKKVPCPGGPFKILMNGSSLEVACASNFQVFSIDSKTGDLSPLQTISMHTSKGDFNPISMSYGIKNGYFLQAAYFYVLGATADGAGELQAYDFQAGNKLKLRATYNGFSNPGAMTGLLMITSPNYIAVTNNIGNSVTLLSDDGKVLTAKPPVKVGSADTGLLFGVQPDAVGGIYVMDEQSRSVTEMKLGSLSKPVLQVVKRFSLNTTPTYLGTNGSHLYAASLAGGTLTGFSYDSVTGPFLKDSSDLDAGDSPTAVIGAPLERADLKMVVLYSTTQNGRLRLYQQPGSQATPSFAEEYDTKGSNVMDVGVSAEIGPVPAMIITPATLPDGVTGTPYSQKFKMQGGDTSKGLVLFQLDGKLPDGLSLNTKTPPDGYIGVIQGTPTKAGTFAFRIHAQRGNSEASIPYSIKIAPGITALSISTSSLPDAGLATPYDAPILLTGGDGTQKATWSVSAGVLPPGLALKTGTPETLSGAATASGTYGFTLKAVQGTQTATKAFTVNVAVDSTPLTIITTFVHSGKAYQPYDSGLILVSGGDGTQTATWSVSAGTLPPGLALVSTTGGEKLTGTPATEGPYTFTLKAAQGARSDTQAFSVTVAPPDTFVRALNATTDTNDATLFIVIDGIAFPNNVPGVLSISGIFTNTGTVPYRVSNSQGENWIDGAAKITAKNRNVMVALGAMTTDRKVTGMAAPASFPGVSGSGIMFMNGVPTLTAKAVDVYLLNSAGTVLDHKSNLAYGASTNFSFAPGSYKLKVTKAGSASDVIATSTAQSIAAGEDYVEVVVSPLSDPAKFYVAKEDH